MEFYSGADGIVTTAVAPALALRNIGKVFGSVVALDAAECVIRAGTVHALLGENGAGKTTLMRIAFGLLRPDRGTMERDGHVIQLRNPADAMAAGIGMVQQHLSLVPDMTVAENVALGGAGRYRTDDALARVTRLGVETGIVVDGRARVAELPVAAQQRVEILKAFARAATLLILDEPTALLAPSDARELFAQLRRFAASGCTVVVITHKLRDALDIADEVTVLRRGRTVYAAPARSTSESTLLRAMVDAPALAPVLAATGTPGAVVFRAERVMARDARGVDTVHDASFTVAEREIVGVAGVEGSGHHELLRLLAGRIAPTSGVLVRPPAVGFVPEDRHRDALLLDASLIENVALSGLARRTGIMPWSTIEHETRRLIADFHVMPDDPFATARALSGGNQQRLVLGRELRAHPRAVVCENPTRGLDVRAATMVYGHLRSARDAGAAIVLYSSDIDELLLIADRVLVCFRGGVRETPRTAEAIGRALVGVTD